MPRKPNKNCNVATRLSRGALVEILHSVYAGVTVGEKGVVDCQHIDKATKEPGYGVAFTKYWPQTDINAKPPQGTRVLWFPVDAVKYIPPLPKAPKGRGNHK